jgi:hypothetical protein
MTAAEFHLTPEALLPEVEFSEKERQAIDRSLHIAKQTGAYDRLRDAAAIREELNDGRLHG